MERGLAVGKRVGCLRQQRCAQRHVVVCAASKTTRGRSDGISNTSSSGNTSSTRPDVIPSGQQQAREAPQKRVQGHAKDMQHRFNSIVQFLTPKQAGDAGDVLMIGISLAVFVYLAMQMYRLYYYVYLQLGVMDMMQ